MEQLNKLLTELGISKVRLAKYLGVSRQMLYNYLAIDSLNSWPKEKTVKLLSLLNLKEIDDINKYCLIKKICSIFRTLNCTEVIYCSFFY